MTEAIYKVGDILEFTAVVPRQFGLWAGPIRGLVVKINDLGYEYLSYRLLLSGTAGTTKNMTLNWAFEKDIITAAKRIGHIDISALMFMENDEPDYEKMTTAFACVESANLRMQNAELTKKLKEKTDQVCQLKRENEDIRIGNKKLSESLSNLETKAHSRLDEIAFLTRKVDELKNTNKKQKAECDEANHEISRLRTVIGELNEVINDLHTSTVEFSDLFCSLRDTLQTDDILEGVNKLEKENERLSNENENLKVMNDELRSSEKIRKLEEENGKLEQKISCADKLLAEAANLLYQGRAHLNISAHN